MSQIRHLACRSSRLASSALGSGANDRMKYQAGCDSSLPCDCSYPQGCSRVASASYRRRRTASTVHVPREVIALRKNDLKCEENISRRLEPKLRTMSPKQTNQAEP